MKTALLLLLLAAPASAWTFLGDNFLGIPLDYVTMRAPANGDVPTYDSATGKWKAAAGGGGGGGGGAGSIIMQVGNVGTDAVTTLDLDATDFTYSFAAGEAELGLAYNTIAGTPAQGNDSRFNPTPSGAGNVAFDNGSAYVAATAGAATTVFHGGAAPAFSAVVSADITDGTIAMADLANLAALTVIGRSANSSGVPAAIAGTANQILLVTAAPAVAFTTVSGDLTNVSGAFTIANNAITSAKIADGVVAYADLQNLGGLSLMGRSDSTSGVGADITGSASQIPMVNAGGTSLTFTTLSGDVTNSGATTTIGAAAVTHAKFQNITGPAFVGRSANSSGVTAAIAGTANQIPIVASGGTALSFVTVSGDLTNADGAFTIGALKVTNAMLAGSIMGGKISTLPNNVTNVTAATDLTITATGDEVILSDQLKLFGTTSDPTNEQDLSYDTTDGVAQAKYKVGRVTLGGMFHKAGVSTQVTSSGDQNFSTASFTLPASLIDNGVTIEFYFWGEYSSSGPPSADFFVKKGTTVLCRTSVRTLTVQTDKGWEARGLISGRSTTSVDAYIACTFNATNFTDVRSSSSDAVAAVTGLSTSSEALALGVNFTGSGSDFTCRGGYFRIH